jgi:Trp operon repressor
MEIIEEIEDNNANEREQYWIEYYDSTNQEKGYNINLSNTSSLENHKLTQQEAISIIEDLKNTNLTYEELANKYNLKTAQSIRDINKGITYKQDNYNYPIRLDRNTKAKLDARAIIKDLKETSLTMEEIAKKYNCSHTKISNINTGDRVKFDDENYPIRPTRKARKILTEEDINNIYYDLINTDLTYKQLAEKYGCGNKVFQHINVGQYHTKEGYTYPLRGKN